MKTVYITGSSILKESNQEKIIQQIPQSQPIFEGFLGFLGFDGKKFDSLLGGIMNMFKIGPEPSKEKDDEYTASVKEWANKWKQQREKELKEDMEDKIRVKKQNFEKSEAYKMQKHNIERAKEINARKLRDNEHKAFMRRMEEENKKLESWVNTQSGGPMSEEYFNQLMTNLDKVYADAVPADVRAFNDIKMVVADITRDDKGNFVNDPKQWKQNLVDRGYGENGDKILQDHPELKDAVEKFTTEREKKMKEMQNDPDKVKQEMERQISEYVTDADWDTNEQMDNDAKEIQTYLDERKKLVDKLDEAKKTQAKAKSELQTIEKVKAAADEATKQKDAMKNMKPADLRSQLAKKINDCITEQNVPDTDPPQTVRKFDPEKDKDVTKKLKELGFKDEDLQNLAENDIETKLNNISDDVCNREIENTRKGLQQKIDAYDDTMKAKYTEKKNASEGGAVAEAQNNLTSFDRAKADVKKTCTKYYPSIPDDGTPITNEQANMAMTAIDNRKKAINNAAEESKRMFKEAQAGRAARTQEKKRQEKYNKLNIDQQKEVDKATSDIDKKIIKKDAENGNKEYIELENGNKLYKPATDSPGYDEDMKLYNAAVNARIATVDIGPRPEQGNDDDVTYLKKLKTWEANKRAKTSAREAAVAEVIRREKENNPDKKISEQDALDMMDDEEWLAKQGDDLEFETNEGEDEADLEEDQDSKDAETAANTAKQEVDRLKAEIENEQDPEKKKQLEEELKKAENDYKTKKATSDNKKAGFKNPAKIWHRKKKKNGEGSTKRYYNKEGDSISAKEFEDKVNNFKKNQSKKSKTESLTNNRPLIFEKRAFTFTPIGKVKHNK